MQPANNAINKNAYKTPITSTFFRYRFRRRIRRTKDKSRLDGVKVAQEYGRLVGASKGLLGGVTVRTARKS